MDRWEDKIDQVVLCMIQEIIAKLKKEDPVKGKWNIRRSQEGVIWCDEGHQPAFEMGNTNSEN